GRGRLLRGLATAAIPHRGRDPRRLMRRWRKAQHAHQKSQFVIAIDDALLVSLSRAMATVEVHVQEKRRYLSRIVLNGGDKFLCVHRIDARVILTRHDE